MDEARSERPVMDVRDLVADYPWDEVADPPGGSGALAHLDGSPMTDSEIEQWWSDRLRARQSIPLEPGNSGHRADYAELAEAATIAMITDDIALRVMSRDHLIRSKSAIGRPHDIAVVRQLRDIDQQKDR